MFLSIGSLFSCTPYNGVFTTYHSNHPCVAFERGKLSIKSASFFFIFLLLVGWDEVPSTAVTSGLLYKSQMIDEDDCEAIDGIKIGRGNRSTRRKPAPAPFCLPQIPDDRPPARTSGRCSGKPATNLLSYGAAINPHHSQSSSDIVDRLG
jgi:hypothetical protein